MGQRKVSSHVLADDVESAAPRPPSTTSVAVSISPAPSPMPATAASPAVHVEGPSRSNTQTTPGPNNAAVTCDQQPRREKRKALTLDPHGEATLDLSQRRRQNSNADYVQVAPALQHAQAQGSRPGSLSGVSVSLPSLRSITNSQQGLTSLQTLNRGAGPSYPASDTGTATAQGNYSMGYSPTSASRNASFSSTEFAPQYSLPPIRPNPTPSPRSTQMPPPAHPLQLPSTTIRHPSISSVDTETLPLKIHLQMSKEANFATTKELSRTKVQLRQSEAANVELRRALHNSTLVAGPAPRRECTCSIQSAVDRAAQSVLADLQRENYSLLSKNDTLKRELRRLNQELNNLVNHLPVDVRHVVEENLQLKAGLQHSSAIFTSVEKQMTGAMNPEDNGGRRTRE